MSIPADAVAVPERVRALAGGAALEAVWRNDYGGLTFRTDDERYIKFGPRNTESSFAGEAERLEWAGRYTRVPHVLEVGGDDDPRVARDRGAPRRERGRAAVGRRARGRRARGRRGTARAARRAAGRGVPVRLERAGAHRERGGPRHPRA